uniref:Putative secreted protein n=1 Tax=Anopheles darlingi TaxID=43151 RepID=A0A2M4D2W1_ANODA
MFCFCLWFRAVTTCNIVLPWLFILSSSHPPFLSTPLRSLVVLQTIYKVQQCGDTHKVTRPKFYLMVAVQQHIYVVVCDANSRSWVVYVLLYCVVAQ